MSSKKLAAWLDRKIDSQRKLCWLGAGVSLLLGLVVLYVTFWSAYGIIWFASTPFGGLSHLPLLIAAAAFCVLLFIGNATTDRAYLDQIELEVDPHRDLKVLVARVSGHGWMLAFTDAKAARSFVKMLTTLLYTGPRAVEQSMRLVGRAGELAKIPQVTCAQVLSMLMRKESRVPFTAMLEKIEEHQLIELIPRLSLIEGVVVLPSPPAGLTLAPSLAEEIRSALEKE